MSDFMTEYKRWLDCDILSNEEKEELLKLSSEKEIEDRFYRELEFGTGGMRGVLGIGRNRINIYNVRRAARGVADFLKNTNATQKGVLIGYDTRNFSKIFAEETAKTLAYYGVLTYLFDSVPTVPEVSFGVRELGCGAGVMIPAFFPTYTVMYIFDLVVLVIALILAITSKDKFIGKPDTEETGIVQ